MYAVIEADGFFGDVATVCQVHIEREKAVKSVANDRRWQIIRGELDVGQKVPRSSIGAVYPHVKKTL